MSAENKKGKSVAGMLKLGLVLAIYAAASCTVLAVVNHFTAPRIEENKIQKANAMLKELFPEADRFEQVTDYSFSAKSTSIEAMYIAYIGTQVTGGAVQISGPTYDRATIITGIDLTGKVKGLQFLEISDSPGFGQKAKDPTFTLPSGYTFYDQFKGMNISNGFTAGVTFDAISGATITSKGVADLISTGNAVLAQYFKEHGYEQ